ncbi:hypothetical protein ACSRUE_34085 [Sorangium sp. KYC3313]
MKATNSRLVAGGGAGSSWWSALGQGGSLTRRTSFVIGVQTVKA